MARRSSRIKSRAVDNEIAAMEEDSVPAPEITESDSDSDGDEEDFNAMTSTEALKYIRENYSNPASRICYSSVSGLLQIFPSLSKEAIQDVLSEYESWSLMKSSRSPKRYNPFLSQNIRDVWQLDTIHLHEFSKQNAGVKYIFCAIDVFSKMLWARPLFTCTGKDSKKALSSILNSVEVFPETILCDRGPEFKNVEFEKFLSKLRIKLIFTNSSFKCSHIERAQYTLERLIFSHITAKESLEYINFLQHLVNRYNSTKHSFTKYTPLEAEKSADIQDEILMKFGQKYQKLKGQKPKFKVGDTVRILLFKGPFHRGYNLQRSYERFTISKIIEHKMPLYILRDEKDREILGVFNEYELVRVNLERYRVNVLETKKVRNRSWVKLKYKGYPDEFTEWVDNSTADLVDL